MKPFFGRLGNKTKLVKYIIPLIPKHITYVEPFVGSAVILLNKEESKIEIINDLDTLITDGFKLLQTANPNACDYTLLSNIDDIRDFVSREQLTNENKLLKQLYMLNNTYCSCGTGKIYQKWNGKRKIANVSKYKQRLTNVKIYNEDYKTIINMFDNATTFFFLDPPYQTNQIYKHNTFDYIKLLEIVKSIKGKFLLTLNDSEYIRNLFKDFKMIELTKEKTNSKDIGGKTRTELIIMNY